MNTFSYFDQCDRMMIAYGIEIVDCFNEGKLNRLMNLFHVTVFCDAVAGTTFILNIVRFLHRSESLKLF